MAEIYIGDKSSGDSGETFTRRAFVIGAIQGGILAVLGGRLAWLQIAQGDRYRTLADDNRINMKLLAPSRGQIVDIYGVPLAVNSQNFRVVIIPEQAHDLAAALTQLQKVIPLSQSDIQRVMKAAQKSPSFMTLEVRDNLSWEEMTAVEVNLPDLPGLSIEEGEIRHYPLGASGVHLIGYVGSVSKSDLADDPVLSLPGFKIGKTGMEKYYDSPLRGAAGAAEVEINVGGREVRELNRREGRQGAKISLTVDAELQKLTYDRLIKTKSASAVLMNAQTGAVYALASAPGFDPSLFASGISAETWEGLLADPALPLNNKAAGGQYPPGSTFKMVTALAALEEKIINRNTTFHCPGHFDLGSQRFHCWKAGGHGWMDVVGAIMNSCDTFFYNVAMNLGIDTLAAYARRLGMGDKLGIEMAEERPGLIPTKTWKMGRFNEPWQQGETVVACIGQGYMLATPLQLATMTARLVNGGYEVTPWLTGFIDGQPGSDPGRRPMGFRQDNLDLIRQGMKFVVNRQGGTAYGSRIEEERFAMGGKTGTAQVKRITREERAAGVKNEDLPWKFRHHALFVGYAPLDNPRYACCVVVEHGGSGSAAAAPVARDILMMAQQRDPASVDMTAARPDEKKARTPRRKPDAGRQKTGE